MGPIHFGFPKPLKYLVLEKGVGHVDLNFGCPVRKVTSHGGGAALPHKPRLLAKIIRAAVSCSGKIPITAKFRLGIDNRHLVYAQTGRVAQEEGCAAVTLHARTAEQLYSDVADWNAIGELKRRLSIPVFGNGDVWEAADAIRMMRATGCDGVVIGRGCLGRPWLFGELRCLFEGERPRDAPNAGQVVDTMLEHARRQVAWLGEFVGIRCIPATGSVVHKGVPSFRGSASRAYECRFARESAPAGVLPGERVAISAGRIASTSLQGFWNSACRPPTRLLGQPRRRNTAR